MSFNSSNLLLYKFYLTLETTNKNQTFLFLLRKYLVRKWIYPKGIDPLGVFTFSRWTLWIAKNGP